MEEWFASLSPNDRIKVITLGRQAVDVESLTKSVQELTTHHNRLIDQIRAVSDVCQPAPVKTKKNEVALDPMQFILKFMHTTVRRGISVGTPAADSLLPFVLNETQGVLGCHELGMYVNQKHVNLFVKAVASRLESSRRPRMACYVVLDDVNIPGCSDCFHTQIIHGSTGDECLVTFVTGVRDYPNRLLTLMLCASKLLGTYTSTKGPSQDTRRMVGLLKSMEFGIEAAKQTVHKQAEIQNFAAGIVDTSQDIIGNLNKSIHMAGLILRRNKLHTGTLGSTNSSSATIKHQIDMMRDKMQKAWTQLVQRGESLSRQNTIRVVMKMFPGQIQGFKNPNSLANTLRYYNTTFTAEREKFLKSNSA